MDKQQHKLKRKNSRSQEAYKASFKKGALLAIIIASVPFLFSLHESIPSKKIWSTFLFTYDSKVWEDANLVMWIFTGKAIPLLLLLIWFFTCRHWWHHALIVPIVMYTYQIFDLFNEDQGYFDEYQIVVLLPIMAFVVPSIYLIRAKAFNKINNADKTLEELEEEFMIKPKGVWSKVKQYF